MESEAYYQSDLAWVHHVGYAQHVELTRPGIVGLLRRQGLAVGERVLDVGCGSGLLARALLDEGFAVYGIDASPAMIELAHDNAPGGAFAVLRLPTGRPVGSDGALPDARAVVSTGHVLNYLDSRDAIAAAIEEIAQALRPGGMLAIDLMTDAYCDARDLRHPHCRVEADWTIVTRFSRPEPHRFDRRITVFRRIEGAWRRSDEHHRNVTFETEPALRILARHGIDARAQAAFGDERLPEGLAVLIGVKRA